MPKRMEDFGFFLSRTFASTKRRRRTWPYVPGTYFVVEPTAPVAVTTLGSVDLAEAVSRASVPGLCIVGKVETENIGIEKIIKNILSNPAIRYLVCAGNEPPRHLTGGTILALFEHGIDERSRIRFAPGMRPILSNTSEDEVSAFREQIEPIDMIGCTEVSAIESRVAELAKATTGQRRRVRDRPSDVDGWDAVERVTAVGVDHDRIKLDKAGYFVINVEDDRLVVEHYDYNERLIRIIEGRDARSIYLTLIRNDWVSALDHAAYLGKELARAERSMREGTRFVQDGA